MFDFELEQERARIAQLKSTQEHISLYSVFVNDERARQLLEIWKAQAKAVIPIDSPVQTYAAKEFARRFIDIIEDNIAQFKRGTVAALLEQEHLK